MITLDAAGLPPFDPAEVAVLLEAPASVRGFWLDEEMLEATGLTSVPLLRKIQGMGLLESGYVAMSVGGRRRVWTFTNVLLGQLLVMFADRAGMPIQTAAEWMSRPAREWLIEALDMKGLVLDVLGTPLGSAEDVGTRFIIVNMTDVWFELERDIFMMTEDPTSEEAGNIAPPHPSVLSLYDVLHGAGTALVVDIDSIELAVVDRVKSERRAYQAVYERAPS
jgi:hypothetical protein